MRVDRSIRTGDKKKDSYIEALEDTVESFNGSNVKQLIRSIDNMAGKISKDLDLIASEQKYSDGTEVELSNKLVDTFLKMVEKADKIKNFSDVINALEKIPDEEIKVTTTTTVTEEATKVSGLKIGENPMEAMIKKKTGGK